MQKQSYIHKKIPAAEIGLRADRGCTNTFFAILFILFWALMGYVAFIAYTHGDINRLVYGVDYLGNVCSKGNPELNYHGHGSNSLPGGGADKWSERKYLWYPITFSAEKGFLVKDALKLGVCVSECPTATKMLWDPQFVVPYTSGNQSKIEDYIVLFSSEVTFNRCIPKISDFDCSMLPQQFLVEKCNQVKNSTAVESVYGMLEDGFNELTYNWWVILVCTLIAIVICFIWMFALRRLVKPMVVITLALVLIAGVVCGYLLFITSKNMEEKAPHSDTHTWYFAAAMAVWVVTFLYICVVAFLFRDIMLACDIIEEASKIPIAIPSMVAVPPVLVLCLLPFVFFGLFTAAHIYTCAKTFTHELPAPNFDFNRPANSTSNTTLIEMKEYTFENWRVYAHLFNLFMFLWTMGFIHAIGYMTIAFCGLFWYWSTVNEPKTPQAGPGKAAKLTLGNHLGTLALGSMIIAIVQLIRVIMHLMEENMRKVSEKADVVKFLVKCAQCCLACFERIIKFINKSAYIMTAMTGESFLPAARHGVSLIMGNALSVGAVSVISEVVMILGKLFITAAVVASGYGIMTKSSRDEGYSNGLLVLVVIGIVAYFIACVFINVFGVCIDTVLLSYCYDLEQNNGTDRPHYFPSDLAKHVERHAERLREKKAKQTVDEMGKPLNQNTV